MDGDGGGGGGGGDILSSPAGVQQPKHPHAAAPQSQQSQPTATTTSTATTASTTSTAAPQSTGASNAHHQHHHHHHTHTATEAAIDAYATRVLSAQSPPEARIEPSLGPYVTSLLRSSSFCSCTASAAASASAAFAAASGESSDYTNSSSSILRNIDIRDIHNLDIRDIQNLASEIDEYDSLMELLVEHCSMDDDAARRALHCIAVSVKTGVVDPFGLEERGQRRGGGGIGGIGGDGMDPMSGVGLGNSLGALAGGGSTRSGLGALGSNLGRSAGGGFGGSLSALGGTGLNATTTAGGLGGGLSSSLGGVPGTSSFGTPVSSDDPVDLLGLMLQDGAAAFGTTAAAATTGGNAASVGGSDGPRRQQQLGSAALLASGNGSSSKDEGDSADSSGGDGGGSRGGGGGEPPPEMETPSSFVLDEDLPGYASTGASASASASAEDEAQQLKQQSRTSGGGSSSSGSSRSSMARTPGSGRVRRNNNVDDNISSGGYPAALTPLREDNLIPLDLLGVLDDPPTPSSLPLAQAAGGGGGGKRPTEEKKDDQKTPEAAALAAARKSKENEAPAAGGTAATAGGTGTAERSTDDFPSIAESATTPSSTAAAASSSSSGPPPKRGGKGSKKKSKKKVDLDLAASLFQTSRSRSNSIPTEKSPMLKPMVAPDTLSSSFAVAGNQGGIGMGMMSSMGTGGGTGMRMTAMSGAMGGGGGGGAGGDTYLQQQIESTAEILLTMNGSLGEDAAYEAALVSNADINVAQYVVDGAMGASPVCRHLLSGGCYRSDCQFSHDVDGHTCLFWLRGRCNKGDGCQFLHGFCAKLLDGINKDFLPAGGGAYSSSGGGGNQYAQEGAPYGSSGPIQTSNLLQHNSAIPFSQTKPLGGGSFSHTSPFASPNLKPAAPGPQGADFGSFSLSGGGEELPIASAPTSGSGFSFANIASTGYDNTASFAQPEGSGTFKSTGGASNQYAKIPQDLWHASERRDSSVFHIADPIERYNSVATINPRQDVVDLHFQSVKTFSVVLSTILDDKLREHGEVWVVTGSGHHVDTSSHQKRGGILEEAVNSWLDSYGYEYARGRDRNGYGGAVLVKRHQQ